ncbi:hypothetical protein GCM10027399_19550 [Curvibacter fontanus]
MFSALLSSAWAYPALEVMYLSGIALLIGNLVRWQNPHAELVLELQSPLTLPSDLAQTAPVDGKALLARAQLPRRKDSRWEIELAPLTRMQAWNVTPLKVGDAMGVLGFTFHEEKGEAILRAEYLFVGRRVYGLRSSPA